MGFSDFFRRQAFAESARLRNQQLDMWQLCHQLHASEKQAEGPWQIKQVDPVIGRSRQLRQLGTLIVPTAAGKPSKRVVITGVEGVGKSHLARRAIMTLSKRFNRGYELNGASFDTLEASFVRLGASLGYGDLTSDQAINTVKDFFQADDAQSYVLLVDDVDDPAVAAALDGLLPCHGGCIVVTSRLDQAWSGQDWQCLALSTLGEKGALQLMLDEEEDASNDCIEGEYVAELLDNLPLSLVLASAFTCQQRMGWWDYYDKLRELKAKDSPSVNALQVLSISLSAAAKNPLCARMFCILQFLGTDSVPIPFLRILWSAFSKDQREVQFILRYLANYGIIELTQTTVSFHRLTRTAMRSVYAFNDEDEFLNFQNCLYNLERENRIRMDLPFARFLLAQLYEVKRAFEEFNMTSLACYADCGHCIGRILVYQLGDCKKGLAELRAVLRLRLFLYDRAHPKVAETLEAIGIAYGRLGNIKQMRYYLSHALPITRYFLGRSHPQLGTLLFSLGVAYGLLGNEEEMIDYMNRSFAVYDEHFNGDRNFVISFVSVLHFVSQQPWDHYQSVLSALDSLPKDDINDPVSLDVIFHLVTAYNCARDFDSRCALSERVLDIMVSHYHLDGQASEQEPQGGEDAPDSQLDS